jgi:hypothetical protein
MTYIHPKTKPKNEAYKIKGYIREKLQRVKQSHHLKPSHGRAKQRLSAIISSPK